MVPFLDPELKDHVFRADECGSKPDPDDSDLSGRRVRQAPWENISPHRATKLHRVLH